MAVIVVAAAVVIVATQSIGSHGHINLSPGIGIYSDAACTIGVSDIDWGNLNPGETAATTFYLKNTGQMTQNYTMRVDTWNPALAADYITVRWNYVEGTNYAPGESHPITMYLEVATTIQDITDFSNVIHVSGV